MSAPLIQTGGGSGSSAGAVLLAPSGDQTITGAHELNIPGLTSPGTSPDGIVNIGPAISSLSSFAQATLLPANEFTANITSNLPDAVNSYGALQVGIDSATTFANAMNVFAAASLTANDSSGQDLGAAFFESDLKLNGHSATGGVLGTQSNAIVDGTGTLAHVWNMFAGPVFQNGNATTPLSAAYYGFPLQTVSGSPIITTSATYYADSAQIFSGSPSITTAAQFYAKPNNGLGTLNALFYGGNQGTGASDYAIYLLGGKNNLGPQATSVGSLTIPGSSSGTATIVAPAAAGTPTLTLPTSTGTFALTSQLPATLANASNKWLNSYDSSTGLFTQTQPAFTNISGSVAASQLPNPSASTLGGIQSAAAVSNQWIDSISTSGVPHLSQPAESNLSTTDITTNNVTSTKHGFAPKSPADATQFLNGAATPAYAAVKDSDLSTTDVTTNNVSSTKHGFAPKSPADATQFLNGAATPAFAAVAFSNLSGAATNAQLPNGLSNFNSALQSQVVVSGTTYYLTSSNINLPASLKTGIVVGTTFRWRVFMTKTGAGTGTFQFVLFMGTNGTTADTAIVTQTLGTQTAVADNMAMDITLVFTAVGAGSASVFWSITTQHNPGASGTGFGMVNASQSFTGTVGSLNSTTASLIFGLGFISTTGTPTMTVPMMQAYAYNLD